MNLLMMLNIKIIDVELMFKKIQVISKFIIFDLNQCLKEGIVKAF